MADGTLDPEPINNYGKIQYSRAGRDDRGHERAPGRRVAQNLLDALPEPDGPIPAQWTPEHVGRRLIDAFRVLDRMPKIAGPKGASTGWPEIERSAEDRKGWVEQDRYEELVRSAAKPTRIEMTRMEDAFGWLAELRKHDAGMALQLMYWANWMARRRKLRDLCKAKGWAYSTLQMKVRRARDLVCARLRLKGDAVF